MANIVCAFRFDSSCFAALFMSRQEIIFLLLLKELSSLYVGLRSFYRIFVIKILTNIYNMLRIKFNQKLLIVISKRKFLNKFCIVKIYKNLHFILFSQTEDL